jgi:hypothetical protein
VQWQWHGRLRPCWWRVICSVCLSAKCRECDNVAAHPTAATGYCGVWHVTADSLSVLLRVLQLCKYVWVGAFVCRVVRTNIALSLKKLQFALPSFKYTLKHFNLILMLMLTAVVFAFSNTVCSQKIWPYLLYGRHKSKQLGRYCQHINIDLRVTRKLRVLGCSAACSEFLFVDSQNHLFFCESVTV